MDKRRLVGLLGWLIDTLQKGILSLFDVKNKFKTHYDPFHIS